MCASYMIKQRTAGRFPLLSNAKIYEDYVDKLIVPYTPRRFTTDQRM